MLLPVDEVAPNGFDCCPNGLLEAIPTFPNILFPVDVGVELKSTGGIKGLGFVPGR